MTIIAFIPARGGSQGIKRKNVKPFCNQPLIYWVIKAAQETAEIDKIVVATEDEEIKSFVDYYPFSKVTIYNRSLENADHKSSTESVMLEYIKNEKINDKTTFILMQATTPFTKPSHIQEGLKVYQKEGVSSVFSAVRLKRFFYSEEGQPINFDIFNRPRRQEMLGSVMEIGAFYINSVSNIKKDENRLTHPMKPSFMPDYTFVDLDTEDDWIVGEALFKKNQ